MQDVAQRWTSVGYVARVTLLVSTGVVWAARSLQQVLFDPDYWAPSTSSDYIAVYGFSIAWLLGAGSLLVLREVARPSRALSVAIIVVAAGFAAAGLANAVEDGLGMRSVGTLYVLGSLVGLLGLFVLAAMFWLSPTRRLTVVPLVAGIGALLFVSGGGVLVLVAWLWLAIEVVRARHRPATDPVIDDASA